MHVFGEIQPIDDLTFKKITELVYTWTGISMGESKRPLVSGRLMKRLRKLDFSTYKEYLNYLLNVDLQNEKQIFINLLTTNETYFFREPAHFEELKNYIFPELKKQFSLPINIWSAACSTGAEPYSIAMVADDELGTNNWRLVASDINEDTLSVARSATYPIKEVENISSVYLKKYCLKGIKEQEGTFKIQNTLRKGVSFKNINLVTGYTMTQKFHLIFLRNIMIYFTQETKENILIDLVNQLEIGGYLIVGHSESITPAPLNLEKKKNTLYQKVSGL